jgi:hypothetical protein
LKARSGALYLEGVVFSVVEDVALVNAVVLAPRLVHRVLEVRKEAQHRLLLGLEKLLGPPQAAPQPRSREKQKGAALASGFIGRLCGFQASMHYLWLGLPVPMEKPVAVESAIIFLVDTIDDGESTTNRWPSWYCANNNTQLSQTFC